MPVTPRSTATTLETISTERGAESFFGAPPDAPTWALVLAWSTSQPERTGEIAFILHDGAARVLGRGGGASDDAEPRVSFYRQRPGSLDPRSPLQGPSLSRRQMRVTADDDGVHIERIGRNPLWVNGRSTDAESLRCGDTILIDKELLLLVTRRPMRLPALRDYPSAQFVAFGAPDVDGIVGESPAAWRLRDQLAFVAQAEQHVLVLGESGTGKELVARAIHRLSSRASKRFIARNAATIPPGLTDAELFGNIRDYPNPGMRERPGLIGEADGSTLFLDEIGEMPIDSQAHLLRVLDGQGEYHRLGDVETRRSRLRLLAATNREPVSLKHDFLARFPLRIVVPRLQDRLEDIPLLACHLLRATTARNPRIGQRFFPDEDTSTAWPRVAPALIERLLRLPYATHVRELEGVLLRAIMNSGGDRVDVPEELVEKSTAQPPAAQPTHARAANAVAGGHVEPTPAPLDDAAPLPPRELTRDVVARCLARNGGNMQRTWRELGLRNRFQLYRLMDALGLREPSGPRE